MLGLVHDAVFAFRQIRRHRAYAIAALASMALGIGAAAAVYSVLYAVLIDPYPYRHADRLAFITVHSEKQNEDGDRYFTLRQVARLKEFRSVADAMGQGDSNMIATDGDLPVPVKVLQMTGNGFDLLQAPPILGREFTVAEAPPGAEPPPVAVISYIFWKAHFGGRPDILGNYLQLNHQRYQIISVVGPRFTWHDSEVYVPMPASVDPETRFQTVIRLRDGVTTKEASADLQPFVAQDNREHPKLFALEDQFRVEVLTLNDWLLGQFKGTLLLLFSAVGLLLLIGCGNVSILMLARGRARIQELAMRSALGASRLRILRQLLTEAVLLSMAGAAFGVGLAFLGIRLITGLLPEYSVPHEIVIAINLPVLAFSAAVSILCGLLFGIAPAWQFSRPQAAELLQSAASRSATMRRAPGQAILLAGQVGISVLLLSVGAAAMRNYLEAYTAKLGFDPHQVLTAILMLPQDSYPTWDARTSYYDQVLEKLQAVPGIASTAFSDGSTPLQTWRAPVDLIGQKPDPGRRAGISLVSAGFFSTVRIPLVAGRLFTRAETLRGAPVAVVNQTFVDKYLNGASPIGKQITTPALEQTWPGVLHSSTHNQPLEIVGVVADSRNDGLHRPVMPQAYLPYTLFLPRGQALLVRSSGLDPEALKHAIVAALFSLNQNQTVSYARTMDDFLSTFMWSHERFTSTLFLIFSAIALGLAMVGLFSVVSYGVEQRTREIGIRVALGAQRKNILALTLRMSLLVTASGVAAGVLASVLLSNTVYKWTESSTRNGAVLGVVSAVFLLTAIAACIWPAMRAVQVDPVQALRSE